VAKALNWFEQGLDFADALHLASAGNAKQFATFDRKLARQARGVTQVETLVL
jgi:predicted nucleic acid-binding protein